MTTPPNDDARSFALVLATGGEIELDVKLEGHHLSHLLARQSGCSVAGDLTQTGE
jgi:hypothetical protein